MGRSEKKMGAILVEDRRFREMFGVPPIVCLTAWSMLCTIGSLPLDGTLMYFLWTLCFLKVCAKQGPMAVLCGGADPKTIKKWVWQFIFAIADLEQDVVSETSLILFQFKTNNGVQR